MKEELNIKPRPKRPPSNSEFKADALQRMKKLERRGVTVGTHLDELRSVMTSLLERIPG